MTYQELLDEFCKRRANNESVDFPKMRVREEVDMLEWAIQSILEKLRDEREGPKP